MRNYCLLIFLIFPFIINGQQTESSSRFSLGLKAGPLISKLHLKEAGYHNEMPDNNDIINKIDLDLKPHFGWGLSLFSDIRLFNNLHYSPELSFKTWEDEATLRTGSTNARLYNKNAGWYFLPVSFKYSTNRPKAINYNIKAAAGFVTLHTSHRSEFQQFNSDTLAFSLSSSYEGVSFADRLYIYQPVILLSPGINYKINNNLDLVFSLDYFYFPDELYSPMSISRPIHLDYPFTVYLTNSIINANIGLKYNFEKKESYNKKRKKKR